MKVIAKSKLTEKEAQLIQTEIANLSLVQHPNIVTLIETFESAHVLLRSMALMRSTCIS